MAYGKVRRLTELLGLLLAVGALLAGCSTASSSQAVVSSPTADVVTQKYVALVQHYWGQHASARGNAVVVCLGAVVPSQCASRANALLLADEQFLSDLEATPPPPRFAKDDQIFRTQIPKADVELNAMISAGRLGDINAVLDATNAYLGVMIPTVTDALDEVDKSQVHR